ncbi:MAG TPA: hypothetical protein VHN74_11655 [Candidatus Angelobacter sp.]|nr:hypothetical protein [Candidatus Angelobacter sp.]
MRREKESAVTDGYPHQGITLHRLRVGGGAAGFIFTAGSVLIFLIGIPAFWGFLAVALLAGTAVAVLLRKRKPLKITTIGGS